MLGETHAFRMDETVTGISRLLDEIRSAASPQALWDLVLDYYLTHGIKMISYHSANARNGSDRVIIHGFPEDWVCRYIGDGLRKVDPIPDLANAFSFPFRWSQARELAALSRENLAYLETLEASGLGDGFAFCVFGPRLRNGFVGLGFGEHKDCPSPEQVMDYQVVAQVAHLRFCELTAESASAPSRLSSREKQVLEWVARGKSNSVIADIMKISPHTVDTMMRRIYDKLDVTDRTSAAIKALGSGLLQYQDVGVA